MLRNLGRNSAWPRLARCSGIFAGSIVRHAQLRTISHAVAAVSQSSSDPIYITTPIFYVNAVPHIGHLHSAVLADTLKRFHQLQGKKVLLSTGTDEHGLKIQQAAAAEKTTEIELCDRVSKRFQELFDAANISYTTYYRTTEPRHFEASKQIWRELMDRGFIYKGKHEGWYSVSDEAFYTETQIQEKQDEKTGEKYHIATETGKLVEWTAEENYKFKLSEFTDKLSRWLEQNPEAIEPKSRHQEVQSWLSAGLADLSISRPRSRLTWGVPVPGDPDHVMYVWLDALTNYISVTGYPWKDRSASAMAAKGWPATVQIVGKDILRFHAVYWPAFLMAAGLPIPKQIVAHSHWTMNKTKMSKSLGNVVDPFVAMADYGTDTIRFYLMNDGGLANDADFSLSHVAGRYKKMLAGQLGNLLSRSTSLALNPSTKIPRAPSTTERDSRDEALYQKLQELPALVEDGFKTFRISQASGAIFDMLAEANTHFTANEPWNLIKNKQSHERLQTVLWYTMESVRVAATMLQPMMPTKAPELLDRLGVAKDERTWEHAAFGKGWSHWTEESTVGPLATVFPILDKK